MYDRAIIFVAINKDNYVKMSCNAAMTFKDQNIPMFLLTQQSLYSKHKELIDTYFSDVHFTTEVDPGLAKMKVLGFQDAKTMLYIDADSLASFNCNLNESFEYFENKKWDFWVWAYSVQDTEKNVQSFWANFKIMKERFNLEHDRIANGTQSSCFFYNTQSLKIEKLAKKTVEVFWDLKTDKKGLTNKWMKDFVPDELILTISLNLLKIDVDIFTDNFVRLGLIERTNKIDENYFFNDRQILSFPSGQYKLRQSLKHIYNKITLKHAKQKGIKPFYSYKDKDKN